jgi:Na+-translocating ferredoxin:NAD+ oxidoreductase subunit D
VAVTFVVSASPHIRTPLTSARTMWTVNLALLPAAVAGTLIFGWRSLLVMGVSVAVALATELLSELVFRREVTLRDGSAVVTGLLLAFTLPPTTPWWMVALGSFVAIFLVKQLFGGLGFNIFNPALAARAVLLSSFPVALTSWSLPSTGLFAPDVVTSASVLGSLKEGAPQAIGYLQLLVGRVPGSLGETCKIALIAGFVLLLVTRAADWRVPITFVGSAALLAAILGRDPLAEVLSGGLLLGALFMATDPVSSPTGAWGRVVFGTGCGLLTSLIRVYGGFPEGVCYAIILMNCLTPLIDKYVVARRFGARKPGRTAP